MFSFSSTNQAGKIIFFLLIALATIILQMAFDFADLNLSIGFLIIMALILAEKEIWLFASFLAVLTDFFLLSNLPFGLTALMIFAWAMLAEFFYQRFLKETFWGFQLAAVWLLQIGALLLFGILIKQGNWQQYILAGLIQALFAYLVNLLIRRFGRERLINI